LHCIAEPIISCGFYHVACLHCMWCNARYCYIHSVCLFVCQWNEWNEWM